MTGEKKEIEKTVTKTKAALGASHLKIQQLFKLMVDNGASDLHLKSSRGWGLFEAGTHSSNYNSSKK